MNDNNLDALQKSLSTGGILSFSARSTDPLKFRRVCNAESDRLSSLAASFPQLAQFCVGKHPPIVVNHYPAALGPLTSAVVIDTFMRQVNFSRALHLSNILNRACIVLGQPLALGDFILKHLKEKKPLPNQMVLGSGGYTCPKSLEAYICGILQEVFVDHIFLHGYGVAEVEYGVFAGQRSAEDGVIRYRHIAKEIKWKTERNLLYLQKKDEADWFCTNDHAFVEGDSLIIRNGESRLASVVMKELESWAPAMWRRRTGYLCYNQKKFIFQCREGVSTIGVDECEYFDFCRNTGMSFLNKPDWQLNTVPTFQNI